MNRNRLRAKCEHESVTSQRQLQAVPMPSKAPTPSTGQGAPLFTPTLFLRYVPTPAAVCEHSHKESSEFPSACGRPKAGTAGCFILNSGQVTSCLPMGKGTATSPSTAEAAAGAAVPVPQQDGSPAPTHLHKHLSLSPLRPLEKPHGCSKVPSTALGPAMMAGGPLSTPSSEHPPPRSRRLP